jgi:hypothetical protein
MGNVARGAVVWLRPLLAGRATAGTPAALRLQAVCMGIALGARCQLGALSRGPATIISVAAFLARI